MLTVVWHEGDVVRKLRASFDWTLQDLSTKSGVPLQVIHRIESGKTKEPKRETLRKIAAAFGLTDRSLLDAIPRAIELPVVEGGKPGGEERGAQKARRRAG